MDFSKLLQRATHFKKTENGMNSLETTSSKLVDIFSDILSYRNRHMTDIYADFNEAYQENPDLAMKLLFYVRNIRGLGQGERNTFRVACEMFAEEYPESMRKNLKYIPQFGRYDDLYVFCGTPLEKEAFDILKEAAYHDLESDDDLTLVGKWLKSINATSYETRILGLKTAKHFGITPAEYRKLCSKLREKINIVERKICSLDFKSIDYSKVPSKAMHVYYNLFMEKDSEHFTKYLESLKKGETKVNANAIYPYEILEKYGFNRCFYYRDIDQEFSTYIPEVNEMLEAQWKSLPNYIEGEHNALVVADTSGSMFGRPYAIALSLAIYMAERNKGAWHNKFITFSSKPKFVELKGSTLKDKLSNIVSICENTDIEKVFNLILNTAIAHDVKQEDMVERIIIVSDMQFDVASTETDHNYTFTEIMKRKYERQGYKLPELVFWNASPNYESTFHADSDMEGVKLVSGASPSIFKEVLSGKYTNPYDTMVEVLNSEIFDVIKA